MRIREIIKEGRDAYLFHGTDLVSALGIIATNRIESSSQYEHNPTGVSLTRDYLTARDFGTYWERQFPVVFVLDQQKLVRSRMKLLPRQDSYPKGSIVPDGTTGKYIEKSDRYMVDNTPVYRGREAEEMVLSDIYPLSEYLVSINVSPKHLEQAGSDPDYYAWMSDEGRTPLSRKQFFSAIHALLVNPLLNRWVPRVQWAKNAEQIPESYIAEAKIEPSLRFAPGEDAWMFSGFDVNAEMLGNPETCLGIYTFTSLNGGQGNGEKALRWLKSQTPLLHVYDPGEPGSDSFAFWHRMCEKGLINSMEDEDGNVIYRDGEWADGWPDALTEGANRPVYYIRFGDVPEGERSTIGARPHIYSKAYPGDKEKGVSVFDCQWSEERQRWLIVDVGNFATLEGLLSSKRPAYLVTGKRVRAVGSDEETLLRNIAVVEQLPYDKLWVLGWGNDGACEEFL